MEKLNINSDSVFAKDPEIRAYLYQRLSNLQANVEGEKPVSVVVQEHRGSDNSVKNFEVQLWVDLEIGSVSGSALKANLYEAISFAAEKLEAQVNEVQNAMIDIPMRDQVVQEISSGRAVLH